MDGFGFNLIKRSLLAPLRVRRTSYQRANQAAKAGPDQLMATTAKNRHNQFFLSKNTERA
jgi:hypothetical protein